MLDLKCNTVQKTPKTHHYLIVVVLSVWWPKYLPVVSLTPLFKYTGPSRSSCPYKVMCWSLGQPSVACEMASPLAGQKLRSIFSMSGKLVQQINHNHEGCVNGMSSKMGYKAKRILGKDVSHTFNTLSAGSVVISDPSNSPPAFNSLRFGQFLSIFNASHMSFPRSKPKWRSST